MMWRDELFEAHCSQSVLASTPEEAMGLRRTLLISTVDLWLLDLNTTAYLECLLLAHPYGSALDCFLADGGRVR
jgi:hypothetical protein